jgi:hypothetical protein
MNSKDIFAVVLSITLLATGAHARSSVPIVNHESLPTVSAVGKSVSAEQVKQAIVMAATSKGWTTELDQNGAIIATLIVRNKHTIVVTIPFAEDKFSVLYRDSFNMNYNNGIIHPHYNSWVQNLLTAIRSELSRL